MDHSQQLDDESISSKQQKQSSQLEDIECSQQQTDSLNTEDFVNFEEQQTTCSNSEHSEAFQKENEGVLASDNIEKSIVEGKLTIPKDQGVLNDGNKVEEESKSLVYNNQTVSVFQDSQAFMSKKADTSLLRGSGDTISSTHCSSKETVKSDDSGSDLSDFEDLEYTRRLAHNRIADVELPSSGEIRETLKKFNNTLRKSSSYSEIESESENESVVTRLPVKRKVKQERVLTRYQFGNSSPLGNTQQYIFDTIAENIEKIESYNAKRDAHHKKLKANKINTEGDKKQGNMASRAMDKGKTKVNNTDGDILPNPNRIKEKEPLLRDNQSISGISTRNKRQILLKPVGTATRSRLSLEDTKHSLVIVGKNLSNTKKKDKDPVAAPTTRQTRKSTKTNKLGSPRSELTNILPSTTRNETPNNLSLKKKKTALVTPRITRSSTAGSSTSAKVPSGKRRNVNMDVKRTASDTTISKMVTRSSIGNIDTPKMTRNRLMRANTSGKPCKTASKSNNSI